MLGTAFPNTPDLWLAITASYALGAIPFGLVLARVLKGVDLRDVGSGNIGATNAMRVLGKPLGLFAFALDWAKGFVPVFWFATLAATGEELEYARLYCGAAAVVGHCFPVYLKFKGGKGVATGCGSIVAVEPLVFLAGGAAWLVTLGVARMVGLASMVMGVAFPVAAWWLRRDDLPFQIGCGLLTLLILIRHRANLGRMLRGEEPRIGKRSDG